jgi:WD40 repeat protein
LDEPIGKIVYSTKINQMDGDNVFALGPSPDSECVGVETLSAHSGDAATGGHVLSSGPERSGSVLDITWSLDAESIASAGDHIKLWDVITGKTYYTFSSNRSVIRVLAWSPNGNDIVSATALHSPEARSSIIQVWVAK